MGKTNLIDLICPTDQITDCYEENASCDKCEKKLQALVDEHDAEVIDKFVESLPASQRRTLKRIVQQRRDIQEEIDKAIDEAGRED